MLRSTQGICLIELIVAVVLLVTVAASLLMLTPQVVKNMAKNRWQSIATNLSTSKMQELQTTPYPLIQTTYETAGGGAWFTNTLPPTAADTCDCSTSTFSLLPSSDTVIVDGNTFRRYWCINAVQNAAGGWHAYCTPSTDQYKNIRLWVTGDNTSNNGTVTAEYVLTRF